jgi:hypothetical protein
VVAIIEIMVIPACLHGVLDEKLTINQWGPKVCLILGG